MPAAILSITIMGSVLFDEGDVERYDPATGTFTLTPSASRRLVANWDDFLANDENVALRGTLVDADGKELRVELQGRTVARGTVSLLPDGQPETGGRALLCGSMPLVDDGRVRVALVAPDVDLKAMVEEGGASLTPVLGVEVVAHLRSLGRL